MNRILTCPHCGPTLTEARLRCDRCGRELVYVSEAEFAAGRQTSGAVEQTSATGRRGGLWAGVAAAAFVVVAMAGLARTGCQARVPAPQIASTVMAAPPPAVMSVQPSASAERAEPDRPDVTVTVFRPGDLEQALEHNRAALAEKPADAELLGNVGQILVAMNRSVEAVPFLEKAVEAEPLGIVARFDLAVAYGRSGKLKEAVEQYETLARSGDADYRAYHNLGLVLRQLGRNAEAAAAFERATALAPERAPGWMGLALSLEADGHPKEAASALERYLLLEPGGTDADNVRARVARLRAAATPPPAQPEAAKGTARR